MSLTQRSSASEPRDEALSTVITTVDVVEKAAVTLKRLGSKGALEIWRALGLYLYDQLIQHRPVKIDRFGVFGLNECTEPVLLADPVFLQTNRLREKQVHGHAKGIKQVLSTKFGPLGRVNCQEIASRYLPKCKKEVVQTVIQNVIALIGKLAKQGRQLRISFSPIGEWQCDDESVVRFQFDAEFFKSVKLKLPRMDAKAVMDLRDGQDVTGGTDDDDMNSNLSTNNRHDDNNPELSSTGLRAQARNQSAFSADTKSMSDKSRRRRPMSTGKVESVRPASSLSRISSHASNASLSSKTSVGRAKSNTARSVAGSINRPKQQVWTNPSDDLPNSSVLDRVRSKLVDVCGQSGLNALGRVIKLMGTTEDGVLSPRELKFGLRDMGIELTPTELSALVSVLDSNQDGSVDIEEMLTTLRGGQLSIRRQRLIEKAFQLMDPTGSGSVILDDLRDNYDAGCLPRVRSGKKSREQALNEFLREWEPQASEKDGRSSNNDGLAVIPFDAFNEYYHNVSACIPDDSEFELMMRQCWHVIPDEEHNDGEDDEIDNQDDKASHSGSAGHARSAKRASRQTSSRYRSEEPKCSNLLPSSSTRAVGSDTDGDSDSQKEAWKYLQTLLLPRRWSRGANQRPSVDELCRRLSANRILGDGNEVMNTRTFAHAISQLDRQLPAKKASFLASLAAAWCNQDSGSDIISVAGLHKILNAHPGEWKTLSAECGYSSRVIDRVRDRLLRRAAFSSSLVGDKNNNSANTATATQAGFHGLQRSLRLMDRDGDRRLSKDELKLGLQKFGIDVNFHEIDCLFSYFDTDRSGCISSDEFLVGMRGDINPRRLGLIHTAFDLLDKDGSGQVTLEELQTAYDCSKHPDVISGKLTEKEALQLFARQWETDEPDGIITRAEFENYYKNVSASIDLDDYFELMMRNAWHISGGSGQCANSSNRRVLVTKADGSEVVAEIRDDLGIKATDFARMRENLEAQGLLGHEPGEAKLELHGYFDRAKSKGAQQLHRSQNSRGDRPERSNKSRTDDPIAERRFHRRSQFLNLGSGTPIVHDPVSVNMSDRERQRAVRVRAAELIQTRFRGFRARKFVALVRRKIAAEKQHRSLLQQETAKSKPRVRRAALRGVHGF